MMVQLSLAEIISTLRRQWPLIVGASVLGSLLVAGTICLFAPQQYTAATTIIFERESQGAVPGIAELVSWYRAVGGSGAGQTFEAILRSRRIRERVAEEMDLPEILEVPTVTAAAGKIARIYQIAVSPGGILAVRATWQSSPRAFASAAEEDKASRLAAELANTLVAALGEFLDKADYRHATAQRKLLEEQLAQTEQELLDAEDALVAYATQHSLVNPSSQSGARVEALSQLGQREVGLRVSLRGARETEQAALERLDTQERMALSSISEQRNSLIDELRGRILDLYRRLVQQTQVEGKSDQHPDVQFLQAELEKAEGQLADELRTEMFTDSRLLTVDPSYRELVDTALSQALQRSGLEAQMDVVRAEKQRALAELSAMPSLSVEYDRLQRRVRLKSEAYDRLSKNYETARLAEAATIDKFSVLDTAIPPAEPSGPSLRRNAVIGAFASFVIAVLLAFWREGRSEARSLAEPADAEIPSEDTQE